MFHLSVPLSIVCYIGNRFVGNIKKCNDFLENINKSMF